MSTHQLAKKFVKDQLRIMRQHGGAPKLDTEQMNEFIASVEKTFESLRPTTTTTTQKSRAPRQATVR